ncbi:MAG: 3-methyl-2-oxobutanoate dehydrogenase subunit VorB [Christensenellaceae bacterium]|jgi:2-oxoglutarate ferredoxin oxidoreductase subunit alpha|nr:3-methyl-2-oxobutanoate dehydrogenase subunit VorB [Christensenellaceae bacterium]
MAKKLMKGNEAIAEAAIQAGCRFFFGYPITPQNEIPEYMAKRMPQVGGCFVQAESEVSAINMVYGAAGAGARVMTSSSSPGISLKQEGISYAVGAELPMVVVNIVRGGPGLGSIQPAQSDYYQATRGGGHGDYRMLCYAPSSVQEAVDLMAKAFDAADEYRNPVMMLGDGMLGQIMEPVEMVSPREGALPEKTWAAGVPENKGRAVINSLFIDPIENERHNQLLEAKYQAMRERETLSESIGTQRAEVILVAYGTMARICERAARDAQKAIGAKVGLVRPVTVWPFPDDAIRQAAAQPSVKRVIAVEMSAGQMVDDVRIAVNGTKPVGFYGTTGGVVPTVQNILDHIQAALKEGN